MQIINCNQINYLMLPYDICYSDPSTILLYDECNIVALDISFERCNYYLKVIIDLTETTVKNGDYTLHIIANVSTEIKEKVSIKCPC